MSEYFYSYKAWLVVIIIIIVLLVLFSNFSLKMKEKEVKEPTVVSPTTSTTSSDTITFETTKCEETSFETLAIPEDPRLPKHIINPEYRPQEMRKFNVKPSKGEIETGKALERIFGAPFHSAAPEWLTTERGHYMQLDWYNDELGIAAEYNGRQHYHYTPHFHRNGEQDFHAQVKRDKRKRELCDQNGVYLITIPYNCPIDQIENFIRFYLPSAVSAREGIKLIK